jgi:membrane protein required for colicin V production
MHTFTTWVTHMNWVDFVFLVVIVYSALTGAWLGFLAEALSVAGVLAGTIVAGVSYTSAASVLGSLGVPTNARAWLGFVVCFVLVSLVFRLIALRARRISRVMGIGWTNALTGALLGILAGGGICLFAVVAVLYFHIGTFTPAIHQSQIATSSGAWLMEFTNLLPGKMQQVQNMLS